MIIHSSPNATLPVGERGGGGNNKRAAARHTLAHASHRCRPRSRISGSRACGPAARHTLAHASHRCRPRSRVSHFSRCVAIHTRPSLKPRGLVHARTSLSRLLMHTSLASCNMLFLSLAYTRWIVPRTLTRSSPPGCPFSLASQGPYVADTATPGYRLLEQKILSFQPRRFYTARHRATAPPLSRRRPPTHHLHLQWAPAAANPLARPASQKLSPT